MAQQGASFGQSQEVLAGRERCATCHGPGKSKDVRKVHEVGRSSSVSGGSQSGANRDGDDDEDDDGDEDEDENKNKKEKH